MFRYVCAFMYACVHACILPLLLCLPACLPLSIDTMDPIYIYRCSFSLPWTLRSLPPVPYAVLPRRDVLAAALSLFPFLKPSTLVVAIIAKTDGGGEEGREPTEVVSHHCRRKYQRRSVITNAGPNYRSLDTLCAFPYVYLQ